MNNYHIQIPSMPKPEDFGITDSDWDEITRIAQGKLKAYRNALQAWKEAASVIRTAAE